MAPEATSGLENVENEIDPVPVDATVVNFYFGIDPGQSGGMALIDQDGTIVFVEKMPNTERDTYDLMREARGSHIRGLVELVHSMPKQGVSSSFKFGRNYGFLRGCLIAAGIPFEEVSPGVWQRSLGCLSKGNKNVTKQKAQQLFPGIKVTHAIADALLIAEYARRKYSLNQEPSQ